MINEAFNLLFKIADKFFEPKSSLKKWKNWKNYLPSSEKPPGKSKRNC